MNGFYGFFEGLPGVGFIVRGERRRGSEIDCNFFMFWGFFFVF